MHRRLALLQIPQTSPRVDLQIAWRIGWCKNCCEILNCLVSIREGSPWGPKSSKTWRFSKAYHGNPTISPTFEKDPHWTWIDNLEWLVFCWARGGTSKDHSHVHCLKPAVFALFCSPYCLKPEYRHRQPSTTAMSRSLSCRTYQARTGGKNRSFLFRGTEGPWNILADFAGCSWNWQRLQ